jgi:hypothetical protein
VFLWWGLGGLGLSGSLCLLLAVSGGVGVSRACCDEARPCTALGTNPTCSGFSVWAGAVTLGASCPGWLCLLRLHWGPSMGVSLASCFLRPQGCRGLSFGGAGAHGGIMGYMGIVGQ